MITKVWQRIHFYRDKNRYPMVIAGVLVSA